MQREETARKVSECLIRFVHDLRRKGFSVTPAETADVFRALNVLDLSDETEVRIGLRAVLCSTREEYDAFDALFAAFLRELPVQRELGSNGGAHMRVRRQKKTGQRCLQDPEGGNGSTKDGAKADVSERHAVCFDSSAKLEQIGQTLLFTGVATESSRGNRKDDGPRSGGTVRACVASRSSRRQTDASHDRKAPHPDAKGTPD